MKCRSCGGNRVEHILDLGSQAWCNDFLLAENLGNEKTYPLRLVYCIECELSQLDYTVPKETMFKDHTYVSGTTKSLAKHFLQIAEKNKQYLDKDDLILDIGGNDGTQLLQYKKLGYNNLLNIESANNIAELSVKNNIPTINDFFNEKLVDSIGIKAKLISASGVFFHLEELHSVIRGIKKALDTNGIFVVQFMYFGDMIRKTSFDGIYHEHLCYYSIQSLINLLEPYGLDIFDIEESGIHGGSMIARVSHNGKYARTFNRDKLLSEDKLICTLNNIRKFADNVSRIKIKLLDIIEKIIEDGGTISAVGAPAKGNTLLTYCGLNNKDIDEVGEVNPLKLGRFTPVTHLPIVKENKELRPNRYFLLLSWNFADEIMAKYPNGSRFILPFPSPMIIYK